MGSFIKFHIGAFTVSKILYITNHWMDFDETHRKQSLAKEAERSLNHEKEGERAHCAQLG